MDSEATPIVVTETPVPTSLPNKPTARDILQSLKSMTSEESPLDFIKNNTRPVEPVSKVPEQMVEVANKIANEKKVEVPEAKPEEKPAYDLEPKDPSVEPKKEEPKAEEPKKEETASAEQPAEVDEDIQELVNVKEENFKTLRKRVRDTEQVLKEKEAAAVQLAERIKKYETGEEFPEVIKAKETRIAELEKYERLHALKTSPAYREKFVVPFTQVREKLAAIAKDYNIPVNVVDRAIGITNKKDLNSFLLNHFDDVGALEAKQLITRAQEINDQSIEAEKEPAKILDTLEQEYRQSQEAQRQHNARSIVESSKDGWRESLLGIRKEGKIKELIMRENDPEFNKTYVEPILNAAGTEYGKLVKVLSDNGLKELPKPVAYALARMVHLAHASAISIASRDAAEKKAEELRANTARTTKYLRPNVGSGGRGAPVNDATKPRTPYEAADLILGKVMGKR